MDLQEIKKVPLSRKKPKRLGRGPGSGHGKTCGKGTKGQNSRSGVKLPRVFEGGTMPLYRRIPKRGFNNARFRNNWIIVNVGKLNTLSDGQTVSYEELVKANILNAKKGEKIYLKILGGGELTVKKLTVKAHKISDSAKEQIEKNQGTVELLSTKIKYEKEKKKK